MEDIAPQLLETLRTRFSEKIAVNPKIRALAKKIKAGDATYVDAEDYAYLIGNALSEVFMDNLSSAVLPDGRMYFNIAQRVLQPLLEEDHAIVSEAAAMVQTFLNQKANIGIKAQTVPVDEDRVYGIVNKVAEAESFDDVKWVLDAPVVNFSMNVVDETLRANVDFQGRSGLTPKVIRKSERKCCKWCSDLVGVYDYPVDREVYRRHERCRCTVDYDPGDGRRQNVHTKRWTAPGESDMIEERKRYALSNLSVFRPADQSSAISSHVKLDRENVLAAAKNGKRHSGVYRDAVNKTKRQLQDSIVSRVSQVERHADKIAHPDLYVADWNLKDPRYQAGLLKKWEKDMKRNAEQAEIELAVWKERF